MKINENGSRARINGRCEQMKSGDDGVQGGGDGTKSDRARGNKTKAQIR